MGRSQQVRARNGRSEVAISTHETDALILPVAQLEQLHQFRPDLVDFVIQQTQLESEFRRNSHITINRFIALERILGILCALSIGIFGIIGGGYVGLHGQPILGGTITTAALATLAIAFLKNRNSSDQSNSEES